MHKLNPEKKIVVLVNRVHLVHQQHKAIKDATGLEVAKAHGQIDAPSVQKLKDELSNSPVLVVTAGLYVEMLTVIHSSSISINHG